MRSRMRQLQTPIRAIVCLILSAAVFAEPALASPILYTFTATLKIFKQNADVTPTPLSGFEDAFWFPTLTDGATYSATGRIEYQPALLSGSFPQSGVPMVFISFGQFEFAFSPSLGFGVGDNCLCPHLSGPGDYVTFVDTFPTITAGYTPSPNSFFYGEDGVVTLYDPTGTALSNSNVPSTLGGFSSGNVLYFGKGSTLDPNGNFVNTRIGFSGSIDSIQAVPEPSSFILLGTGLLGVALLVHRRGKRENRRL